MTQVDDKLSKSGDRGRMGPGRRRQRISSDCNLRQFNFKSVALKVAGIGTMTWVPAPHRLINCLFLLLMFAQGCASIGGGVPEVELRLRTSADLNPDASGRPSPVVLKIYDLKARAAFENARFVELWDNAHSILGADLVHLQETELFPRHAQTHRLDSTTPGSRFVGIVAGFRNLDQAVWRGTIELPESGRIYINVDIKSLAIDMSEGKRRDNFLSDSKR